MQIIKQSEEAQTKRLEKEKKITEQNQDDGLSIICFDDLFDCSIHMYCRGSTGLSDSPIEA